MSDVSRRQLRDRIAAGRRQGRREYQEDNYLVVDLRELGADDDDAALLLLADGMGGHAGGAVASELVVNTFGEAFLKQPKDSPIPDRLSVALASATGEIAKATADDPSLEGMGCTLIAAVVYADKVVWLSVGDSPLWLFRNGALVRLNEDHSMKPFLDRLVEKGELTAEEAANDPRRNALRSALDGSEPDLVDLRTTGYRLQAGDLLLMASDGLESLSDRGIIANLEASVGHDVEARLNGLLDAVIGLNYSHQDNTTAILLEPTLSEATRQASDDRTVIVDKTLERPPLEINSKLRGKPGAQGGAIGGAKGSSATTSIYIIAAALVLAIVAGTLAWTFSQSGKEGAQPPAEAAGGAEDQTIPEDLLNPDFVEPGQPSDDRGIEGAPTSKTGPIDGEDVSPTRGDDGDETRQTSTEGGGPE